MTGGNIPDILCIHTVPQALPRSLGRSPPEGGRGPVQR